MISVNELRIGNYIHSEYLNSIGSISEIRSDNATLTFPNKNIVSIAPYDELLGIPLTEEWLKKCNHGFDIRPFHGKFDVYINLNLITSIQFVHQLQNLYFALTSEELTFTT